MCVSGGVLLLEKACCELRKPRQFDSTFSTGQPSSWPLNKLNSFMCRFMHELYIICLEACVKISVLNFFALILYVVIIRSMFT